MSALRNPVFVLAWALPGVAVLACLLTIVVTVRNPDSALPEQYHWEGFQLDRDFSRAAKAAELGVQATVANLGTGEECELRLRMEGTQPGELVLRLAHGTKPDLDRQVAFSRVSSSLYRGRCSELPEGHWRLELVDSVNGWAIRQSVQGSLANVTLNAVSGS